MSVHSSSVDQANKRTSTTTLHNGLGWNHSSACKQYFGMSGSFSCAIRFTNVSALDLEGKERETSWLIYYASASLVRFIDRQVRNKCSLVFAQRNQKFEGLMQL